MAHYLAMDVGLVTPKRDGMNLVAKEMIICNPKVRRFLVIAFESFVSQAALMISSGAGTEQQLNSAGFYTPVGFIFGVQKALEHTGTQVLSSCG